MSTISRSKFFTSVNHETRWVGACDMADESNIAILSKFDGGGELLAFFGEI